MTFTKKILNKDVVKGIVGSLLSTSFDEATESPSFHEECWELCCSSSPKVAIAAPRAHAKTSGITLGYGMSALLFRDRKFMLLVSDTEAQASLFLGAFKQQLQDNQELRDLFDVDVFIKDTETDCIVSFKDGAKFRIIAKGAEQKLRGLIWEGLRPDIILCDDMENDELVMNKDRREKMRRWFYSALLPCMSRSGVIRVVGTILHMDSLLERLMPENQLIGNQRKFLKFTDLKTWTDKRTPWRSIRYKAHNKDYNEFLWPQRYDKEYFKLKYADYLLQGIPDAYSQEYLNTPLDDSTAYFKRNDFQGRTEADKSKKLNNYIAVDLAISEAEKSDYSAFVVAGMDENRVLHVHHVIRERLDAREIVDTLFQLQKHFNPVAIGIEDMQVTKSIGPFLNEDMLRRQVFLNVINLKHGGKDKIARARSIQARMRSGAVKFEKDAEWFQDFQDECVQFPRGKHDDQVDAFAYLGLMLVQLVEAPTEAELIEEDYIEEREEFDRISGRGGRSSITGY